jgi:hypothetical protein
MAGNNRGFRDGLPLVPDCLHEVAQTVLGLNLDLDRKKPTSTDPTHGSFPRNEIIS